jgi:peptide/nickel transport system permease protein
VRHSKTAIASLVVIVLLILMAIFAPVLCAIEGQGPNELHNGSQYLHEGIFRGYNPDGTVDLGNVNVPLAQYRKPSPEHWLGIEADHGRDLFARLVYGARVSLAIALLSTLFTVVVGTVLGAVAGYLGGKVDAAIGRINDLLLAFPVLLFALAVTPIVKDRFSGEPGSAQSTLLPIVSLIFILGFFGAPYLARVVRGEVISLREREFIDAARSLGATSIRIVFREILPNVIPVVIVYATLAIPMNIVAEAALSFMGVGVQTPTPSWGQMLDVGAEYYEDYPWMLAVPGLALVATVLAFNLLGDVVSDAIDPRAARE